MVLLSLGVAAHRLVSPNTMPFGDIGGYVLPAERMVQLAWAGDLGELWALLVKPVMHPPLHKVGLAIWISLFGATQAATQAYGAVIYALTLLLFPLIGERGIGGARGALAGLVVSMLLATSGMHLALSFSAMSEGPALLLQSVLVLTALNRADRPSWRADLAVGLLLLAASLVRYNLLPMLLLPLVLHHLHEGLRHGRTLIDRRLVAWAAPAGLLYGTWLLARPSLASNLSGFFVNTGHTQGVLSWQYLGAVPDTLSLSITGSGWLTGLLFLAVLVGLAPAVLGRDLERQLGPFELRIVSTPGLRLLQVLAVVGVLALTVHPYKLMRLVHPIAPLLLFSAVLPFARSELRQTGLARGAWVAAGLVLWGALASWHWGPWLARHRSEAYPQDPTTQAAVDRIVAHGCSDEVVWVVGTARPVASHVVPLAFLDRPRFDDFQ